MYVTHWGHIYGMSKLVISVLVCIFVPLIRRSLHFLLAVSLLLFLFCVIRILVNRLIDSILHVKQKSGLNFVFMQEFPV
jgi:hypothetical protein